MIEISLVWHQTGMGLHLAADGVIVRDIWQASIGISPEISVCTDTDFLFLFAIAIQFAADQRFGWKDLRECGVGQYCSTSWQL